ncbi:MAG: 23S rRNA (pseudouridine(1915)-N(3))-methyltransferase RlmH [Chitinispirillaceae bacterium]|nr:23S rRNA (pseudouridine(1915)-N(3))-methyltransferase RlmH [Chitinispirillaceae bacterium]
MAVPDITLLCVGAVKDRHCAALVDMYLKRLRHEARIEIREIGDGNRHTEGERIAGLLDRIDGRSFALSEDGRVLTSRRFASRLETINRKIIFIVGGPDGLSERIKKRADEVLSLSPLTFTHEIARLLLVEQIYRACSILHHRRYHRG